MIRYFTLNHVVYTIEFLYPPEGAFEQSKKKIIITKPPGTLVQTRLGLVFLLGVLVWLAHHE